MTLEHRTLISSVQRALKVVDIVAGAPRPMPVKAVAQASGLSLGTAYNLTRTLVHEGYLVAEPDGLVLGLRFPSLRGADAGVFLARVRQTLHHVAAENGATAYLARFSDGMVSIIDIVDATGAPGSSSGPGSVRARMPPRSAARSSPSSAGNSASTSSAPRTGVPEPTPPTRTQTPADSRSAMRCTPRTRERRSARR